MDPIDICVLSCARRIPLAESTSKLKGCVVDIALHNASQLLPYLDRVDLQRCGVSFPSRVPLSLAIPKVKRGLRTLVGPALPALAVRKVRIRPSDGDVEDEVELLVKGCVLRRALPGWESDIFVSLLPSYIVRLHSWHSIFLFLSATNVRRRPGSTLAAQSTESTRRAIEKGKRRSRAPAAPPNPPPPQPRRLTVVNPVNLVEPGFVP